MVNKWPLPVLMLVLGGLMITIPYSSAASNTPPEAFEDTYLTFKNTPLIVAAPGVLENDKDQDQDPLTAVLEDNDIEHGTLVFNSDGSFTYTPDQDFTGLEKFTYRAFDGTDFSPDPDAFVFITVSSDDPPQSPVDAVDEVIISLEEMVLSDDVHPEHVPSLIAKLEGAVKNLENGKITPAINKLEAFINQVESNISTGKMTEEDGQILIDAVQDIIDDLNS